MTVFTVFCLVFFPFALTSILRKQIGRPCGGEGFTENTTRTEKKSDHILFAALQHILYMTSMKIMSQPHSYRIMTLSRAYRRMAPSHAYRRMTPSRLYRRMTPSHSCRRMTPSHSYRRMMLSHSNRK